jgi:hypothetical protein
MLRARRISAIDGHAHAGIQKPQAERSADDVNLPGHARNRDQTTGTSSIP